MRARRVLPRIALAALGVAVLALAVVFLHEPRYGGSMDDDPGGILVFAHRGFGDLAPDNSLVAARLAVAAGLDGVDVDGQRSADGQVVIFHDLSVDRLTEGTGRVADKTTAELLALDLAPGYEGEGGVFESAPVSTFETFVREITPHGILMVELKVPGSAETGIEARAAEIIDRYAAHERVFLSSFNPLVLRRLEKIDPRINTAFIFMDTNWNAELLAEIPESDRVDLPWFIRQEPIRRVIRKIIRPDALSVNHAVDEAVIDRLIEKGWPVFLWTIDDPERLRWAAGKNPYGVISDQPLRAAEILRRSAPAAAVP
ncbi:MAG: hypothetical protein KY466_09740 [Gemmatimonadetes bacterium]|nr:hypothetical protein [Gemmatimonadota bacterium]